MIAYGLVGYTSGELSSKQDSNAADSSLKDSGVSYGVGVSYAVSSQFNLSAEYVHYYEGKTSDASPASYTYRATNVGVTYSF